MIDQSQMDVRSQAEKAPLVFRGRVLTVEPDPTNKRVDLRVDGKPVNTHFVAKFQVDALYKGKLKREAGIHFTYSEHFAGFLGHNCIDFRPGQTWLIFAAEKKGMLELTDDCTAALRISSRLAVKPATLDWPAQIEADLIAGLDDPDVEMRIFSIQRLGGLRLPSSRPVLHQVIDKRKGIEAEWAIYAAVSTGDVTVLPLAKSLLASSDNMLKFPNKAIVMELRNVKDPNAAPDLLDIFEKSPDDYARFAALQALVENIKDPRVIPVLGSSLSSSDRQIRYLAIEGLKTIAKAEACSTRTYENEDDEAAFARKTASCKAWWDREGQYQPWPRK